MTAAGARVSRVDPGDELIADNFHGISQTLTALECGLELSLPQDQDATQLHARIKTAPLLAQVLRQRMVELRGLLELKPQCTQGEFEQIVLEQMPQVNTSRGGFMSSFRNMSPSTTWCTPAS